MPDSVSATEFDRMGLGDWRYLLGGIEARFEAGSFVEAASFVERVAEMADQSNHHPDIDLRYPGRVRIRLTTHATGGLSDLDVSMARDISQEVDTMGLEVAHPPRSMVELAIDAIEIDVIRPFWAAVLAYRENTLPGGTIELVDPERNGPSVWFQQMHEPRDQRNRIHLDVCVPHDEAVRRVDAALAAGGTLVSDDHARAFWVLADAEGNEACITTWQDRD